MIVSSSQVKKNFYYCVDIHIRTRISIRRQTSCYAGLSCGTSNCATLFETCHQKVSFTDPGYWPGS